MQLPARIIDGCAPDSGTHFRKEPYGARGAREFLRDVIALSNADVDGPRYIVVGIEVDSDGHRSFCPVNAGDFDGKPDYVSLVRDYIEPALDIRYDRAYINGQPIGCFEIADCREQPYMMRIDFSETLRRGDAYTRVNSAAIKMGRQQLHAQFKAHFQNSVSANSIEIGFAGEVIHKDLHLNCRDLTALPSAMAAGKLEQLMQAQLDTKGADSLVARMIHARLYGSDEPYVSRSPEDLLLEMGQIRERYAAEDRQYLFGGNATEIQAVVYNQSDESILDASLKMLMPQDDNFFVADRPPDVAQRFDDDATYPVVDVLRRGIRITQRVGDIPAGEPFALFPTPVLVCAGPALAGRKFGVRYSLTGQNLRSPAKGKLRLFFAR
jgi:hypothetical protein